MPNGEPRLYGITTSNRTPGQHWGKNQFNSSFPVALACYMKDQEISAVYLTLNENLEVEASDISINEVFNSDLDCSQLYFAFESRYQPYARYVQDELDSIDLVVQDTQRQNLRPLEIKLTVIPDNTTYELNEEDWGSEIVFRPPTLKYCAIGIIDSCREELESIRDIFEPVCHSIQGWGNNHEIWARMEELLNAIDELQMRYHECQKPLLMQPIWKTQGRSPLLAERAFDIFIWSDMAFSRLFLDSSRNALETNRRPNRIGRPMRTAARFARIFYEISRSGSVNLGHIFDQMTFGPQSDKEFSVNGLITSSYMESNRTHEPVLPRTVLRELILGEGERMLSPERRLDQTIYYKLVHEIDGD